jgi:calcium/calmodulin-dependent protein kinase (CaM kinase) II
MTSDPMPPDPHAELLDLTQRLLDAIARRDWAVYAELCHESLTAFEPESRGHLVAGLGFHRYYFELPPRAPAPQVTMASPHVRMLSADAALVCYVRLNQALDAAGHPVETAVQETRVWQRIDGRWRHVHFHRSTCG